jgi:hypothetical protein
MYRGVSTSPRIERNGRASIERPKNHLFEPISRKLGNLRGTIPVVPALKTAITGEDLVAD